MPVATGRNVAILPLHTVSQHIQRSTVSRGLFALSHLGVPLHPCPPLAHSMRRTWPRRIPRAGCKAALPSLLAAYILRGLRGPCGSGHQQRFLM